MEDPMRYPCNSLIYKPFRKALTSDQIVCIIDVRKLRLAPTGVYMIRLESTRLLQGAPFNLYLKTIWNHTETLEPPLRWIWVASKFNIVISLARIESLSLRSPTITRLVILLMRFTVALLMRHLSALSGLMCSVILRIPGTVKTIGILVSGGSSDWILIPHPMGHSDP